MRVLALEPYHGGSHRAFLDGWSARSRHHWTVLGLPPAKWKWRMRHAAISFADAVAERLATGAAWDVVFASDMLNLAEFRGLAPEPVRRLPAIVYFHENQLTYPVRFETERDYHFVLTNLTTALAADAVWFNSRYHRDEFLGALPAFLKRMPDCRPLAAIDRIGEKSSVQPQGIHEPPPRGPRRPGPIRLLWAARWEHDKNPETFFDAVSMLQSRGVAFRLSVVGEQFRDHPPVFDHARENFRPQIDAWGFQPTRPAYDAVLADADVFVSTAHHEFFGVSVVEAMAAGAYPMLPRRLAYPEILGGIDRPESFFYDGSAAQLADRLAGLAERLERNDLWEGDATRGIRAVRRFLWTNLAAGLDEAAENVAAARRS